MRAALWDLDGTLIDSAEYHWEAWVTALAREGYTLTRDRFLASFGQRNDRILAEWLGAHVTVEQRQRIGDFKEATYRRLMRERGIDPVAGAAQWVTRLGAHGWRQVIASSAPRMNVDAVLEALEWQRRFDAIVAAEDVRVGKPDPEVFLTAAARVQVRTSACVVVEDAAPGVEAARRAGMRVIGVGPGAAAADLSIASLHILPADAFDRLLA